MLLVIMFALGALIGFGIGVVTMVVLAARQLMRALSEENW